MGGLILKFIFSIIIIAMILSSCFICRLSEQVFQEAISQVQVSEAVNTPKPTLTPTLEPAFTSTVTPAFTPTETQAPSQTPTLTQDLRIITADPKDLLLSLEELPSEPQYYLPNEEWMSQLSNSDVISDWGVEEGELYLEETGRINGWVVTYKKGSSTASAPEQLYQNIVQYETSEGANIAFTKYAYNTRTTEFSLINHDGIIGDATSVFMHKTLETDNRYRVNYVVQSRYKNYISIVAGWGWEDEFNLDYVIRIAEIEMDKIKSAPMGNW
jgi:hypothetical protein